MNKILPPAITSLLFTIIAMVFPLVHAYATPSLTFDQTNIYAPQDSTFTVKILINLDGNTAWGSKATIQYTTSELDVVSATKGTFFNTYADPVAIDTQNGLVEITGYSSSSSEVPGSGTFASITFKSKKNSGSGGLAIACSTDGSDSNILKFDGTNILDCSKTNTVALKYGATNTTLAPTVTTTPVPAAGTVPPTCSGLSTDKTGGTGTPLTVKFSCSGVYTNGYINAAYFDFGDGTSDTIEKNVGSPGTVTTTHSYMTVGSLGASCKVRNNDFVWSSVPDACKRIITIKPVQVIRPVVVAAAQTQIYVPPATTPTPQIGTLVFITPTATPSPELTETPIPESKAGSAFPWWLLPVGAILIGGVIYLLSKRSTPPPPPVTPPSSPPPTPTA